MTHEDIQEVLRLHSLWLADDSAGKRAVLSGSDLRGSNLRRSNLSGSNLSGSNLSGSNLSDSDLGDSDLGRSDLRRSNLSGSNLSDSDLSDSDLSDSNLRGSNLRGSNLRRSNLRRSNLSGSNLSGSDLSGSDLSGSNLSDSDLRRSDLSGSDLRGSNLRGSDLSDSNLRGSKIDPLASARLSIVPETGQFNGWKKLRDGKVAELEIPHDAARSNATSRKCRASHARALRIIAPDGSLCDEGVSLHDGDFIYRVGETVKCHAWEPDRWVECGGGIHFYLTIEEAKAHV
jgi:uncharacterized protein YjbI with pentapeptide repeats